MLSYDLPNCGQKCLTQGFPTALMISDKNQNLRQLSLYSEFTILKRFTPRKFKHHNVIQSFEIDIQNGKQIKVWTLTSPSIYKHR